MPNALAPTLTVLDVGEQILRLRTAFPSRDQRSGATVAAIYRDGLAGVSVAALEHAVATVIREDAFFPKVARLRAVAVEWDRAHRPPASVDDEPKPFCPNCRHEYFTATHWAPMMIANAHGQLYPALSDDLQHVRLEPRQRIVCLCSAPSQWTPIDGMPEPIARTDTLLKYHLDCLKHMPARPAPREAIA